MNWRALQAHLETIGRADLDGVRIRARYTRCGGCGGPVLSGLDADVAGLPATCDVIDLDRLAEAVVLLSGRRTYRVLELPDRLQLTPRDPWSIAAAAQTRPVVGEHRCGWPTPASTAWRWRIPTAVAATPDGAPPF